MQAASDAGWPIVKIIVCILLFFSSWPSCGSFSAAPVGAVDGEVVSAVGLGVGVAADVATRVNAARLSYPSDSRRARD